MKKPKPHRPWLTPTGVAIPTIELRELCKTWDRSTWDAYLKWYERPLRLRLLVPYVFDKIAEEQTETIFKQFDQRNSQSASVRCEQILSRLDSGPAAVLRLHYFDGLTDAAIGSKINRARTTVSQIKNKAIGQLRQGIRGDNTSSREFMKGESFSVPAKLWDQKLAMPLKEPRAYDPANHREEVLEHKFEALAIAARSLSEKSIRALYLRYWCDFSISTIAREHSIGVNTAELLIEASVSKLKRKIVEIKLENIGGAKCS